MCDTILREEIPRKIIFCVFLTNFRVFLFARVFSWGIRYHRPCPSREYYNDLPHGNFQDPPPPLPDNLPSFPTVNPEELTCYVDAAYANDLRKRRSTTGYAITMAGGAIFYRSKTQSVTALSSTEAEFLLPSLLPK